MRPSDVVRTALLSQVEPSHLTTDVAGGRSLNEIAPFFRKVATLPSEFEAGRIGDRRTLNCDVRRTGSSRGVDDFPAITRVGDDDESRPAALRFASFPARVYIVEREPGVFR